MGPVHLEETHPHKARAGPSPGPPPRPNSRVVAEEVNEGKGKLSEFRFPLVTSSIPIVYVHFLQKHPGKRQAKRP